jgi:hypothetical protein
MYKWWTEVEACKAEYALIYLATLKWQLLIWIVAYLTNAKFDLCKLTLCKYGFFLSYCRHIKISIISDHFHLVPAWLGYLIIQGCIQNIPDWRCKIHKHHNSTHVKTVHVHPATFNLAHWLTRHGSHNCCIDGRTSTEYFGYTLVHAQNFGYTLVHAQNFVHCM